MTFILNQLKNIPFSKKLYYLIFMLFVKLLIIVVAVGWLFWLNRQEVDRWRAVDQQSVVAWNVMAQLQELNGHVYQYVLHHQEANRAVVETKLPEIEREFDQLVHMEGDSLLPTTTALQENFKKYIARISYLFQQMARYGVTHEQGIYGQMRGTIHRVESLLERHPVWGLQLLNIRRAEKDFMLRMEEGYAIALGQKVNALLVEVTASADPNREEMARRLIDYREKFQELASLTLAMQNSIQVLYTLWREMSGEITALRTAVQQRRETERMRYDEASRDLAILFVAGIVLVLGMTGSFLSVIFHNNILKPIRQLTQQTRAIAHGEYDRDISLSGQDEIGVLASHLQRMKESLQQANRTLEQQVEERTRSLTRSNADFQQSLKQLERTRDELIQSEKVALLGRLVAGFAHEINTPIGIGVGSISALPDYLNRLETLLAADEVDGDRLDEVFAKIRDMSSLCLNNLRNVADLVTRFKRTSVDQTSEQPRRFNVHELLLDVITTLQHLFKRSAVEIVIDCPDHIIVKGQPGALGQVMTNLLMNSFRHGFEEGQRGGIININVQHETKHDNL